MIFQLRRKVLQFWACEFQNYDDGKQLQSEAKLTLMLEIIVSPHKWVFLIWSLPTTKKDLQQYKNLSYLFHQNLAHVHMGNAQ